MNYSTKEYKLQVDKPYSWIYFEVKGIGCEWYDIKLPTPNYLLHTSENSYLVGWCIFGDYSKYLQEIKNRFVLTLSVYDALIINTKPLYNQNAHLDNSIHRLSEFNVLDSIKTRVQKVVSRGNLFAVDNDEAFLNIKFYCEYLIKQDGCPSYQDLEYYALANFPNHKKGRSTIKAKCRSVFNWYAERDFKCGRATQKYKDLKEYWENTMATRKAHMIKINKAKADEKKRIVVNLTTGLLCNEYKKASGKWNVTKIAKDGGISRDTVYKYLP